MPPPPHAPPVRLQLRRNPEISEKSRVLLHSVGANKKASAGWKTAFYADPRSWGHERARYGATGVKDAPVWRR